MRMPPKKADSTPGMICREGVCVMMPGYSATGVAEKLPKACTCAALIVVLAREVYGVADEQRIAVAADIHGFDGSWALGAMVYEIAQGSGQYGLVGAGGIAVAGALLVGLVVSGLRRTGWARRLSTYVRLY